MANHADDPQSQSKQANSALEEARADGSMPSGAVEEADDVTVVGTSAAMEAQEFPQGLSPRELSLTLKGQLLGHFHLQEFIGGGGMGAVFKALDTTLDRIVAVKVVASQSVSSEDLQRRFLVEAQSTARLDHPNIARIHYVGRDRGLPYIVFEYIDGVNLRDLVANHGTIPLGDALSFTCQIAQALAHAWQKEVVHRDIKPSNILITRDGQAKLVDMGLARLDHVDPVDDELTNTGVTLGTFDYISPEQARDPRQADTRSDIYSLGCTLFYMLVGRPPFADGTGVQKLLQHQDKLPPSISQLRPELPESLSMLASSMLAKSPDLRPQTPTELVKRCYTIFHELGIQPPPSVAPILVEPTPAPRSDWSVHLPWVIPIIALVLFTSLWGSTSQNANNRVEFQPIRRPAPSSQNATPEEIRSMAEPPGELPLGVESSSEAPINNSTVELEPAIDPDETTSDWDFISTAIIQPVESSLLDFSSREPPEAQDAGDIDFEILDDEGFDLGEIIKTE